MDLLNNDELKENLKKLKANQHLVKSKNKSKKEDINRVIKNLYMAHKSGRVDLEACENVAKVFNYHKLSYDEAMNLSFDGLLRTYGIHHFANANGPDSWGLDAAHCFHAIMMLNGGMQIQNQRPYSPITNPVPTPPKSMIEQVLEARAKEKKSLVNKLMDWIKK